MPTGIIKRWLGDKGFGFISPDDQTHDIFAHIRQKAGEPSEPVQEGRRVVYEAEYDPQKGKPKASSWYFADAVAPMATTAAVLQQPYQQQQQQQQQLAAAAAPQAAVAQNPAVAQLAANSGVGYQALVQAATTAISAIAANPQGNNAALLANLANLAQQPAAATTVAAPQHQSAATVVAPPPAPTPPPPPAPQHSLEEVQVPAQFMQQVIGTGGSGLEEIKKKAGGDIVIELGADAGGMRTLKVKGPPISASLGACLIMQQVAEGCVMAN